jgi:S1-C subfamily serine protease
MVNGTTFRWVQRLPIRQPDRHRRVSHSRAWGLLFVVSLFAAATSNAEASSTRVKSGTGFFVSPGGFLVTSAHVVAGCHDVSVWTAGDQHPGYVITSDPRLDVALLWARGRAGGASAASADRRSRSGEEVLTLGFATMPNNPLQPLLSEGAVLGEGTVESGGRVLLIDAKLRAGSSGGAVLSHDGFILGMIIGRDEHRPDRGIALPIAAIEALLASYGIALPRHQLRGDPLQFLEAISALVQCSS